MSSDEELATFVAARLDEDEAAAKAATPGPWEFEADDEVFTVHDGEHGDLVGEVVAFTRGWADANGEHIARHDPARVLREVAAKREILEMYTNTLALVEHPPVMAEGHPYAGKINARDYLDARRELTALRPAAAALAAIWNGHPDYRDWKP